MPRKSYMEFQSRWLDYVVEKQPIREWCRPVKGENRKARCIYCNSAIKFDLSGLKALKRHASSNRHQANRMAALHLSKKASDSLSQHLKTKESLDALAVLHPRINFNCTVDLRPLSVLSEASKQVRSSSVVSLLRRWGKPVLKNPFIDIYICFFCGEEFISRPKLQNHKKECHVKAPEHQKSLLTTGKVNLQQQNSSTFFSPHFNRPSGHELSRTVASFKEVPQNDCLPSKATFVTSLGLIPKKKAAQVCQRRRNTECESIDLNEDIPLSPTIPRTPKLLISHLSRDGSDSAGANSTSPHFRRSLFSFKLSRTDKEAGEKTGSSSLNDKEDGKNGEKLRMSNVKSLYILDLTSPLGQFVIKHIKGDPYLHVLSDVESHCLTSAPKKNAATIQLRERCVTYPVTFKEFVKKSSSSYAHHYKFTRKQKVEFMRRVETGLDKKSRKLFKRMKACKVSLTPLTKADFRKWMLCKKEVTIDVKPLTAEEINYWTSPKAFSDANTSAVFPSGLSFSSPDVNNVLGLRTCRDAIFCKVYPLSVSNYVSEETFAEVMANRRAVYKSLLSDSENSGNVSLRSENPAVSVSILRQMLSCPAQHTSPLTQAQGTLDAGHLKIDQALSLVHPVGECPLDENSYKEGVGNCRLIPGTDTSVNSSGSTVIGSLPQSCSFSNAPQQSGQTVTKEAVISEESVGPVRSGIHTVLIRHSVEGETIKSLQSLSVKPQTFCRKSRENLCRVDKKFKAKDRMMVKKTVIKMFGTSSSLHAQNKLRRCSTSTRDILRLKEKKIGRSCSFVKMPNNSSIKMNSRKQRSSRSESSNFLQAGVTRATKAIKVAVQRLSRDSFCPATSKWQRTLQINKVQGGLKALECSACSTFDRKTSEQIKLTESRKSHVLQRKLPKSSTSRNNNSLEKASKTLSLQINKHSTNYVHVRGQQEKLETPWNEKQVSSAQLATLSSRGLTSGTAVPATLCTRNSRYTTEAKKLEEAVKTKNIENANISSRLPNCASKKFSGFDQDPSPLTSGYDHQASPQKSVSSTGLRFVAYSSPLQLRQSSLMNTVSIPRKAEERKSLLSSFLVNAYGKNHSSSVYRSSQTKSFIIEHSKSAKDKLKHSS